MKKIEFDYYIKIIAFLAKIREEPYYPKGGYSSEIQAEWDALLDYGKSMPKYPSKEDL